MAHIERISMYVHINHKNKTMASFLLKGKPSHQYNADANTNQTLICIYPILVCMYVQHMSFCTAKLAWKELKRKIGK